METNNVGGGEVLQYVGNNPNNSPVYLDENIIKQFMMLPGVKVIIMILLIAIAFMVILKILEIKSPFRGKAIDNELDHLAKVRKRDDKILKANKWIGTLTKIIEHSPLAMSKSSLDYWTYNLERANIRIPGGTRVIKPQEFNAIVKSIEVVVIAIALVVMILINSTLGVLLIIMTPIIGSTIPLSYIRQIVKAKDSEIIANFCKFYLMIHCVLLSNAGTAIAGIMKSYDKTTNSEEMHRFIDVCIHYIDTYGEYEATRYIAKQYREIPQVGKLMRLIRQANEGGDVRVELLGFKDELLADLKYEMQQRGKITRMKAKASFNILVPVLIQAIVSAMAIYLEDLSLTSSFM